MTAIGSLTISETQKILHELQHPHPNLNKIGQITKENRWSYYFNAFFHHSQPRWLELVHKINRTLADQEKKGIKIFEPSIQEASFLEQAKRYRGKKKIYFDTVLAIGQQIEMMQNVSWELKQAYHELKCRELGLRYGLGKQNGGLDPLKNADSKLFEQIKGLAQKWKDKQVLSVEKKLDSLQEEQLKELARYPDWLKVVIENPQYLSEVFNWTLHNFQRVEIIVKNDETRRMIKAALLPANLGYVRNLVLTKPEEEVIAYRKVATKSAHVSKQILTASIYHGNFNQFEASQQERVNILNPSNIVHFKEGHYNLTVAELFKELSQKGKREANITLCAEWGFSNFHPVKGRWNDDLQKYEMPSMKEHDWIDYAPPSRIASHAEMVQQYGDDVINSHFFFKVMATRQHKSLKALDCHAYLQLCDRMKDGNWKVVNIGFYAYRFQQGLLDGLSLFCATLVRVLSLLDQNSYYSHRQRGEYPIFCPDNARDDVLKRVYQAMKTGGVFQFAGRNCAYSAQEIVKDLKNKQIIDEEVSNFFKIPLTKATIGVGPIDGLIAWTQNKWEWVQWVVMTLIHSLFLSHRSLHFAGKKYSVRQHFNEEGLYIHNPSFLHQQIEEGLKNKGPFSKGALYWSHTDEKKYQRKALLSQSKHEVT
ncbi:MAG: hypothetical protein ACH350_02100 [Parachlamydiaceae bacterium]